MFNMKNYQKTIQIAGIFLGVILILVIYKYYNPLNHFFPKCPVNYFTGFYCPGCGSQRSIHFLLNFDFFQAASQNILVFLSVIFLVGDLVLNLLGKQQLRPYVLLKSSNRLAKKILFIIIIFTILRNTPMYPFTILAPNTQESASCKIEHTHHAHHEHEHSH